LNYLKFSILKADYYEVLMKNSCVYYTCCTKYASILIEAEISMHHIE